MNTHIPEDIAIALRYVRALACGQVTSKEASDVVQSARNYLTLVNAPNDPALHNLVDDLDRISSDLSAADDTAREWARQDLAELTSKYQNAYDHEQHIDTAKPVRFEQALMEIQSRAAWMRAIVIGADEAETGFSEAKMAIREAICRAFGDDSWSVSFMADRFATGVMLGVLGQAPLYVPSEPCEAGYRYGQFLASTELIPF